jgi:hypothetical protein
MNDQSVADRESRDKCDATSVESDTRHALALFRAQDPYRPLDPRAKRVDFYEPSYVQAAGRVRA